MKQFLISLFVFCGPLYALSDTELLPKIMKPIKKNIESSKTWGDYFKNSPTALGLNDVYVFDQLVGMDKELPKMQVDNNLRTITVGEHKIEIVNLQSRDFLIDGHAFRYEKNMTYLESLEKLRQLKSKSEFALQTIFSSVAMAQIPSSCDTNTRMFNQISTNGLVKEIGNNIPAVGVVLADADERLIEKGRTTALSSQRCDSIINDLQQTQTATQAHLVGFSCESDVHGADAQLVFKVPISDASDAYKMSLKIPDNPMMSQADKERLQKGSTGQIFIQGAMTLSVDWQRKELREKNSNQIYRFSESGDLTETLSYGAHGTAKCSKGGNGKYALQISNATKTIAILRKEKVCANKVCMDKIQNLVKTNLLLAGDLKDTSEVSSPYCDKVFKEYLSNPCMTRKELNAKWNPSERRKPGERRVANCGTFRIEPPDKVINFAKCGITNTGTRSNGTRD